MEFLLKLKRSTGLLDLRLLGPLALILLFSPMASIEYSDVVIVGAGASGIAAFAALRSLRPSLSVRIVEARDRIGTSASN